MSRIYDVYNTVDDAVENSRLMVEEIKRLEERIKELKSDPAVGLAVALEEEGCCGRYFVVPESEREEFARDYADHIHPSICFDDWPFTMLDWSDAFDDLEYVEITFEDADQTYFVVEHY